MKLSNGELAQMEQAAKNRADNTDRCVFCGAYVPEGRQVCKNCEEDAMKIDIEQPEKVIEEFLRQIRNGELVNVVRCKDCKFAVLRECKDLDDICFFCTNNLGFGHWTNNDNFCSYGIRKKDK